MLKKVWVIWARRTRDKFMRSMKQFLKTFQAKKV